MTILIQVTHKLLSWLSKSFQKWQKRNSLLTDITYWQPYLVMSKTAIWPEHFNNHNHAWTCGHRHMRVSYCPFTVRQKLSHQDEHSVGLCRRCECFPLGYVSLYLLTHCSHIPVYNFSLHKLCLDIAPACTFVVKAALKIVMPE